MSVDEYRPKTKKKHRSSVRIEEIDDSNLAKEDAYNRNLEENSSTSNEVEESTQHNGSLVPFKPSGMFFFELKINLTDILFLF